MFPPKPPHPFALFLDVDGTLIDLAPRPDAVVVPHELVDTMHRLSEQLDGALALVSGRTIADLDHLFTPLRLRASGVHGAEIRFDPERGTEAAPEAALPDAVLDAVTELHGRFPGTLLENKRYSVALHYRAVPQLGSTLERELAAVLDASIVADLRILPGHMVFEIKSTGFDKGVAITRLLEREPFKGRLPVFVGDDVTDEPGFAVVAERGGTAIAVGVERPGTSAVLGSPEAVRGWLGTLIESVS